MTTMAAAQTPIATFSPVDNRGACLVAVLVVGVGDAKPPPPVPVDERKFEVTDDKEVLDVKAIGSAVLVLGVGVFRLVM